LIEWDASGAGFSFVGSISTCDGSNWQGELTESLNAGPVSAAAFAEFNIVMADEANSGETNFVGEGSWIAEGEEIPFQDNIAFTVTLSENGSKALLDMSSTGGVLYMQGQTVPVPQALPATTGELSLPVLPNPSCESE
jgi:hypothetical protein